MTSTRPNIVLLVLDDVRFDRLSSYGYGRNTTPVIDQLARQGARFEQAIAASHWTLPTHASLFTGLYPTEHGATQVHPSLGEGAHTLAELLQSCGYATIGLSNNPWVGVTTALDKGFETFCEWSVFREKGKSLWRRAQPVISRRLHRLLGQREERRYAELTVARALYHVKSVLAERDRPFFLFINLIEPHLPWYPPLEYVRRFVSDGGENLPRTISGTRYNLGHIDYSSSDFEAMGGLYDATIAYVDAQIGRLVEALTALGVFEDTLFCVTSDHGENLGEHRLMGHALCLYDTLLRVPLVMRYPGRIRAGSVIPAQVEARELFPTLLDAAGALQGRQEELASRSLFSRWEALARGEGAGLAFAEASEPALTRRRLQRQDPQFDDPRLHTSLRCVRSPEYKYIWSERTPHEFYDLKNDPGETTNLIQTPETAPPALAEMKAALERWMECLRPVDETAKDELDITETADEEVVERLKAMGYL
jgi:arylsulfatase A-like enzyme